jgi:hypothetical protein
MRGAAVAPLLVVLSEAPSAGLRSIALQIAAEERDPRMLPYLWLVQGKSKGNTDSARSGPPHSGLHVASTPAGACAGKPGIRLGRLGDGQLCVKPKIITIAASPYHPATG